VAAVACVGAQPLLLVVEVLSRPVGNEVLRRCEAPPEEWHAGRHAGRQRHAGHAVGQQGQLLAVGLPGALPGAGAGAAGAVQLLPRPRKTWMRKWTSTMA